MMNRNLQLFVIKKSLRKQFIDPDLIDVHSHTDSSLSLPENMNLINQLIQPISKKQPKFKGSVDSAGMVLKANTQFEKRKYKQQNTDYHIRAKTVFYPDSITFQQYKKWKKQPNRYDIEGIDTKGGFI